MEKPLPRKLRLVHFSPDDYGISSVLVRQDSEKVTAEADIDSVLSLYFQWPEHRRAMLTKPGASGVTPADNIRGYECEMDYDRDERTPSEIRLRYLEENPNCVRDLEGERVVVRFEVFRVCYEMSVQVLARSEDPSEDGWHLIITPPIDLSRIKNRRMPRLELDDAARAAIGPVQWSDTQSGGAVSVELRELGMTGMRIVGAPLETGMRGSLEMCNKRVSVEVVRVNQGCAVVRPFFETESDAGHLFDVYRLIAYPFLRDKYQFDYGEIIELYAETKYFEKFLDHAEKTQVFDELRVVWDGVRSAVHQSTADYVIVDDEGDVSGASSVVRAFEKDGVPVWVLHQLCARVKPEILERSGDLYSWRAEYLAARPGPLKVIGWFDSSSRWLERIYVKFAMQSPGVAKLYPVEVLTYRTRKATPSEHAMSVNIGDMKRIVLDHAGVWGGVGPRFLNASGCLDALIGLQAPIETGVACEIADALASSLEGGSQSMELTLPPGQGSDQDGLTKVPKVDRFFEFDKEGLVDFIASLEHSVAVTKRRKEIRSPDVSWRSSEMKPKHFETERQGTAMDNVVAAVVAQGK